MVNPHVGYPILGNRERKEGWLPGGGPRGAAQFGAEVSGGLAGLLLAAKVGSGLRKITTRSLQDVGDVPVVWQGDAERYECWRLI
jgi:hypothetical protein